MRARHLAAAVAALACLAAVVLPAAPAGGRTSCTGLAAKRDRAVLRGIAWLQRYVSVPAHRRGLGSDTYGLLWEIGRTEKNPVVRRRALSFARREAARLYRHLSHSSLAADDNFDDAAFLLPDAHALGVPVQPLLRRFVRAFRRYRSPDQLYGVDVAHIATASEDDKYSLLVSSFELERFRASFPGRIKLRWGLLDTLRALRDRKLVTVAGDHRPGRPTFHDHAYWATHIAYVLQDYGQLRLRPADTGPNFAYLRSQFWPLLRLRQLELVAEFVDVFRSAAVPDNDPQVCAGTRYVLSRQRRDGSWSRWEGERDPYSAIHPTWVAMDALRRRFFLTGTPYQHRERAIARALAAPH